MCPRVIFPFVFSVLLFVPENIISRVVFLLPVRVTSRPKGVVVACFVERDMAAAAGGFCSRRHYYLFHVDCSTCLNEDENQKWKCSRYASVSPQRAYWQGAALTLKQYEHVNAVMTVLKTAPVQLAASITFRCYATLDGTNRSISFFLLKHLLYYIKYIYIYIYCTCVLYYSTYVFVYLRHIV